MEHSVHIASKHFMEVVAPASPTMVCKKVKVALKWAKQNGSLDLDSFDSELAELGIDDWEDGNRGNNLVNEEDSDITDEDADFTAGDVLGKALALVKQV